jgi:hypothetical protein
MLSQLDRHDLTISRCGIPLIAELLHVCFSESLPMRLEQALIWLGLLHGIEELGTQLTKRPTPQVLTSDQSVALYTAIHLEGNPAQACPSVQHLLADILSPGDKGKTMTPWQVMNQVLELAESSPWEELIRQASLLHLSDPAALFLDWLDQLEAIIEARMPFAELLRFSIVCRSQEKLPEDWQARLAEAIESIGSLADEIPLYRFWMVACQVVPDWDFACIRAADLALCFDDFSIAGQLLDRMEPSSIRNPWFYDVKARCRYAYGDLKAAAHLWSVALLRMDPSAPEYVVLHNRLCVALRGKFGLGEVCRLLRCEQSEVALDLLRSIILHDPSFSNHYELLATLTNCNSADEATPMGSSIDLQGVEQVTERFSSLWQKQEKVPEKGTDENTDQLLVSLQEITACLDKYEESVFFKMNESTSQ